MFQAIIHATRAYRRFFHARSVFEVKLTAAGAEPWAATARKLLDSADQRIARFDRDGAWLCLSEAIRQEFPFLRGQRLSSTEQILRCEAEKVTSPWRKNAIEVLMKPREANAPDNTEEARALRLERAQFLLDDFHQTQYYKNTLLQTQMLYLVLISMISLAVILTLIGTAGQGMEVWPTWDWRKLLVVLLVGVLGSSFSATRKVADDSGKSKIPEMAADGFITIARTVLGATPALAAYAFLQSEILTIGTKDAANKLPVVIAVAFAAGFSERVVLKILESLDGKSDAKPAAKPTPK